MDLDYIVSTMAGLQINRHMNVICTNISELSVALFPSTMPIIWWLPKTPAYLISTTQLS